jgi:hypothetical protein
MCVCVCIYVYVCACIFTLVYTDILHAREGRYLYYNTISTNWGFSNDAVESSVVMTDWVGGGAIEYTLITNINIEFSMVLDNWCVNSCVFCFNFFSLLFLISY